jgi:hypothetical protein
MANKDKLRKQRTGTIINNTSEKREGKAAIALGKVMLHIEAVAKLQFSTANITGKCFGSL